MPAVCFLWFNSNLAALLRISTVLVTAPTIRLSRASSPESFPSSWGIIHWLLVTVQLSTIACTGELERNRYYLSSIIDVVEFLAVNQLPFRGDKDSFKDMSDDGCGLFLSMFEYTLRKDEKLQEISKTIPGNAR